MTRGTVKICNSKGLHARAAVQLVNLTSQFASQITMERLHGVRVNAKSIMNLFTLMAVKGDEITVFAEGPDEAEAVAAVVNLVADSFSLHDEIEAGTTPTDQEEGEA